MQKSMRKLVLFDLDGTLIDEPSSETQFFTYLLKNKIFSWQQFIAFNSFFWRNLWQYKSKIFIKNKAYFAGFSLDELSALAEKFTQTQLLPTIRPNVKKLLDEHLRNQDIVILLTGTPFFIAKIFAQHLQVHDFYATELQMANGCFCKAHLLQHPYAEQKLFIAEKLVNDYNVSMQNVVAYANSIHDRFLLEKCGQAIAVTPDKKLAKLALKNNWKIVEKICTIE